MATISDAANVVSAFDVFVLSSGTAEAFGIVLLEAMQAKVPVISTNALGPAEVVADAGILFKSGDADDLKRALTFHKGMLDRAPRRDRRPWRCKSSGGLFNTTTYACFN